ncbi:dihydrolipoyllysine-residue acetyltransferase [Microvirga massiliensis]|uniref:dihydrolipoyllysine-residue acetyltransferase n=1 Tax=Microvirga massiliensis TaxID=1033741 RepID=UPI00062BC8B0|nr:dihydrolipoyllysine-residue acetyltransferase [Microvirga massiliensis]
MATEVKIPDIGDFKDVPIIEVHVKEGDTVNADDPLVSLESDKATMEVPAPAAGVVEKLLIRLGDRVSEGHPIVLLKGGDGAAVPEPPSLIEQQEPTPPPSPAPTPTTAKPNGQGARSDFGQVHASPSVRRLARELEIDLTTIRGTGEKGRITKDDVKAVLKGPAAPVSAPAPAGGMGIPEIPAVDFEKFGPIETKPLPRIKKISGPHLHRAWLNVPLVTHQDEADITETEAYRKELDASAKDKGYRVTLLAFLMKASVSALKQFPEFNASLNPEKDSLILKRYYHIGVAVDTPEGLVVPVIRDVDRKGIGDISQELGAVSKKARDGKLTATDMQGASFTISSLGGIGGTAFTPLVNAPEVAILGVVRSRMAPVWDGETFKPRLMLPLSLSYDHRIIDGALAARFTRHLAHVLEDIRRLVL